MLYQHQRRGTAHSELILGHLRERERGSRSNKDKVQVGANKPSGYDSQVREKRLAGERERGREAMFGQSSLQSLPLANHHHGH